LPGKIELRIHTHLAEQEIFEVGWFPDQLQESDRAKAGRLFCFELRIDGLEGSSVLNKAAREEIVDAAWRLSDGKLGQPNLVLVEHKAFPKSRVRSYKGFFPYRGKIRRGEFYEVEIGDDAETTFFLGIAPITDINKDESMRLASDFMRSFVLLSAVKLDEASRNKLMAALLDCLNIKGSILLDYMKAIPKICGDGLIMFSFGGDTRGEFLNIRGFADESRRSEVIGKLKASFND
jgi:hypothetical protein